MGNDVDMFRAALLVLHLVTLAGLVLLGLGVLVTRASRLGLLLRVAAIVMGLSGLALVAATVAVGRPLNEVKLVVKLVVLIGVVVLSAVTARRLRDGPAPAGSARTPAGGVLALTVANTAIAYGWT